MNTQIEALFTSALGLQAPWQVAKVELNTGKRRIDFEVTYTSHRAACPECGAKHQVIHERVRRSWRHLDFFQFEAWLHAQIPRVRCNGCAKTTQLPVPWAREGSGFTLLFEALRQLLWGMHKNPASWTQAQFEAMHWLQRSNLKSARAWPLKQAPRLGYQGAGASNSEDIAQEAMNKWLNCARRSRLEPFKRLAITVKAHLGGLVRGMLDGRSNAYVEAMNGLLQQTKTAARGFRNIENFIAMAYLRMSKLEHLPRSPLAPAVPREYGRYRHVC